MYIEPTPLRWRSTRRKVDAFKPSLCRRALEPVTSAERARAEAGARDAQTRVDSLLQKMDPKVRGSAQAGVSTALSRTSSAPVPAYAENSLIALSRDVVAIARFADPSQSEIVYDWHDVRLARIGQIRMSARYRIVGSSRHGVVLAQFAKPDDFMQLAVIPLSSLLKP